MTDRQSWRQATTEEVNDAIEGHGSAQLRWMIPDIRLQAIADEWKLPNDFRKWDIVREGYPELAALLDALVAD
ncbi:hypothetical protein LCGC14_2140980 [marine sediment metagenome]|uniref:Uncharacterized protein n=1 Tax=marine sediment metagenome TaxID=412755 RepID=A0A0F9DYN3_9ZZZZ